MMARTSPWLDFAPQIGRSALLYAVAFLVAFPIYIVIISAFRPTADIISAPLGLSLGQLTTANFANVFSDPGVSIINAYVTTIAVAVLSTFFSILVAAMAAYPLARGKGRGEWRHLRGTCRRDPYPAAGCDPAGQSDSDRCRLDVHAAGPRSL